MKAVWFESFGSAAEMLIVGEQHKPEPLENQVLVHLHTSGVNPSDVKKRQGAFPNLLDEGLVIPHSDGAGVIEAVGKGVDDSRVGERVFVYQAQYGRRLGSAAEYLAIDSIRAAKLPDNTSFEVGACIGIPMMTAHRCVFADGPVAGQTLLVTGGAGRVGYYAVQLAKLAGATVIASASNKADEVSLKAIGADYVVNHRQENWGEQVLTHTNGEKIDRVIEVEFGENLTEVMKCIRIGGTIASYSSTVVPQPCIPFKDMMFMDLTLRMVIVYAMPEAAKAQAIDDIYRLLKEEKLQHRIAHTVPLSDTAHAHELIEQGGFGGCVVVTTA